MERKSCEYIMTKSFTFVLLMPVWKGFILHLSGIWNQEVNNFYCYVFTLIFNMKVVLFS